MRDEEETDIDISLNLTAKSARDEVVELERERAHNYRRISKLLPLNMLQIHYNNYCKS